MKIKNKRKILNEVIQFFQMMNQLKQNQIKINKFNKMQNNTTKLTNLKRFLVNIATKCYFK